MHIWLELYMWQKRYRQFKVFYWNRTCGKRGPNQTLELYMWQNVHPIERRKINYVSRNQLPCTSNLNLGLMYKRQNIGGFVNKLSCARLFSVLLPTHLHYLVKYLGFSGHGCQPICQNEGWQQQVICIFNHPGCMFNLLI